MDFSLKSPTNQNSEVKRPFGDEGRGPTALTDKGDGPENCVMVPSLKARRGVERAPTSTTRVQDHGRIEVNTVSDRETEMSVGGGGGVSGRSGEVLCLGGSGGGGVGQQVRKILDGQGAGGTEFE